MSTDTPAKTRTQKLFRNGGSQAVRIPKEMIFNTDEVQLRKEGDRLIIEPKAKTLGALTKQMGKPLEWNWEATDDTVEAEDLF